MRKYEAHLDIDGRCNYRCLYCWSAKDSPGKSALDKRKPINTNDLRKILPILGSISHHIFLSCAGEPLMHPEWASICEIISESAISSDLTLVTNGRLLNGKRAESLLAAGFTNIYVSIDTLDPAKYSRLCGCANEELDVVLGNIKNLLALRGGKKAPAIFLASVVMKSNLDDLKDIAVFARDNGLNGIKLQWFQSAGVPEYAHESLDNPEDAKEVFWAMQKTCSESGLFLELPKMKSFGKLKNVVSGSRFVKNKFEYYCYWARKIKRSLAPGKCRLRGLYLNVSGDCTIHDCCEAVNPVANLLVKPASEIVRLIEKAIKQKTSHEKCSFCQFMNP